MFLIRKDRYVIDIDFLNDNRSIYRRLYSMKWLFLISIVNIYSNIIREFNSDLMETFFFNNSIWDLYGRFFV